MLKLGRVGNDNAPQPSSSPQTITISSVLFSSLGPSTMAADLQRGFGFSGNYSYSSDSGIRARRTGQNYGGGIEFRARTDGEDESGPPSPPLWKTSPARIPEAEEALLLHHSCLSPTSRTHAIARSRRELMEMIQKMPETSYELSLQDLVEQTYVQASANNNNSNDSKTQSEIAKRKKSQERNKVRMRRSASMETEPVLLKMFFPTSLGAMKKSFSMVDTGSKISNKSSSLEAQEKGVVDKEWWKNRYSVAGDSDSGVTSSNNSGSTGSSGSSSSIRRTTRRKIGGLANCLSCFQTRDKIL